MRYTRIGLASYTIAALLVATAGGTALLRSRARPPVPPATAASGEAVTPAPSGASVFAEQCASCHGEGLARGRSIPALRGVAVTLASAEGGRAYLVDLLLDGRVRTVLEGRVVYGRTHPTYATLPDAELVAVLDHMLTSWGNDALLPPGWQPYAQPEISERRRATLPPR